MNKKQTYSLCFRYLLLIILALGNLKIISLVFTAPTIEISASILSLFYSGVTIKLNTIGFANTSIVLIDACIATAAYYFLFILNLSTPMKIKTRIKSLLFILISFFVINVLRIALFAHLYAIGYKYFDFTHQLTWNFGSTILLVLIWFASVKLFNISNIPVYTDARNLLKDAKK